MISGLKHKIIGLALLSAILPMLVISLLSIIQRQDARSYVNKAIDKLIIEDLTHIMDGFYDLCKTANDFTQQYVNYSLNIAKEKLQNTGPIELNQDYISWNAINQFTKEKTNIDIPKMTVGGKWLGNNRKIQQRTPIVDDVKDMVGATCTIFQRINKAGDMLRIATNVENIDHSRAVGTYIPAVNPDGQENPVVSVILSGNKFRGRAYVVDDWYLTAYEPIMNSNGKIIGMLYVGVKQESAESFRQSILSTKVRENGYLFALLGSGEEKGTYAISKNGTRDGENIWGDKDAQGNYYIKEVIGKAKLLKNGDIIEKIYSRVENNSETPKTLITLYTYFEPWDWVIGADAYLDDYIEIRETVDSFIYRLVTQTLLIGLIILCIVLFFAFVFGTRIANPMIDMAYAAKSVALGESHKKIEYRGTDEVGILANSFNKMSKEITESRTKLIQANDQLTQANATKDKFFSIIAHDLKNPFNTLLTYSATLAKHFDKLSKDKLRQGIVSINKSAERGYNLLVDLLSWARSQLGEIELKRENLNIKEIAAENISLLSERAQEKGIHLKSEIENNLWVYSDKNMTSTVIRNLLTNAIKFTDREGEVKICAQEDEHMLQIQISDTGIGISEENIKKLFRQDTFYRTLGTAKEKGTGLGLILCREFVEKIGGKIWVTSETGKGSQFCFTVKKSKDK